MKTVALTLLALGSASAFAPSQSSSRVSVAAKASTADFDGVPLSLETGGKMFDPVGLSQWAPAEFLRKAELSNGRSAMLANVGWFWPQIAGTFKSDDVTTTDPIDAIFQADAQWWAQFLLFCGVAEGFKYRAELEGKSFMGEGDKAAVDWAGKWGALTAAEKKKFQENELKNGRLAMLGFASYVSAHFIPGSVPLLPGDFH